MSMVFVIEKMSITKEELPRGIDTKKLQHNIKLCGCRKCESFRVEVRKKIKRIKNKILLSEITEEKIPLVRNKQRDESNSNIDGFIDKVSTARYHPASPIGFKDIKKSTVYVLPRSILKENEVTDEEKSYLKHESSSCKCFVCFKVRELVKHLKKIETHLKPLKEEVFIYFKNGVLFLKKEDELPPGTKDDEVDLIPDEDCSCEICNNTREKLREIALRFDF